MPTTTVAHVYPLHNPQSADHAREAKLATTSWVIVIFGEVCWLGAIPAESQNEARLGWPR
jgi:hypothetical protein